VLSFTTALQSIVLPSWNPTVVMLKLKTGTEAVVVVTVKLLIIIKLVTTVPVTQT